MDEISAYSDYVFRNMEECRKRMAEFENDEHERYDDFMREPDTVEILNRLKSLGEKYRFTCNVLLDGLYSNQSKVLYKTPLPELFTVAATHEAFKFLEGKVYSIRDLNKALIAEVINIVSHNNPDNMCIVNTGHGKKLVYRCMRCKCMGKGKGMDKSKSCYDGLTLTGTFNSPHFSLYSRGDHVLQYSTCLLNYKCENCNNQLVTREEEKIINVLFKCDIDLTMGKITSAGNGSICEIYDYAILIPN